MHVVDIVKKEESSYFWRYGRLSGLYEVVFTLSLFF